MTDEKTEKATPLRYESQALAKPIKASPPAGRATGGGGGRPAVDIEAAAKVLLEDRGEWYQVCDGVANPGRFYDGFRAQGAEVRVAATGKTTTVQDADGNDKDVKTYNVWAMIPPGPVVPHKKGKGKAGASAPASATPPAAEKQNRPPTQSGGPSNVRQLPTGSRR